jgi:LysM repeat protein
MSSIRPLVTITILIVVGAFLYVKINEGPVVPPVPGDNELAQGQAADVPPLAATSSAPASDESAAPLWPTTVAVAPAASSDAGQANAAVPDSIAPPLANVTTATGEAVAATTPAIPAIPELPAVPAITEATSAPATGSLPVANALPTNIPIAQYPDQTNVTPQATLPNGLSISEPIPSATPSAPVPVASTLPGSVVDVMAPQANLPSAAPVTTSIGGSTAATNATAVPLDSDPLGLADAVSQSPNPLRPAEVTQNSTVPGPSSVEAVNDPLAAQGSPVVASFAASWPAIHAALERGDLAQAHELLSPWHNEPSLKPAEAENVDKLLGQLAGTVIYSTEHRLGPARVVRPGETLESIAKEYNVPWQLLAKINGIPAANQVRPGQEIKVVPGPFSAVVDLGRSQMTLMVAGRYAGKFPVTVPIGATVSEGEWLVDQKLVAPASGVTQSAYTTQPPRVDHAIVLRGGTEPAAATGGPTLAIASSSNPTGPSAGAAAIQVSAADAEELSDILSIGSRVVIRR